MKTTRAIRIAAACLALSALHCGLWPSDPISRGGGSDTETLTGIISASGAPAARVTVKLLPADYDPTKPGKVRPLVKLTDDSGRFKFEGLDTGKYYNLIAGRPGQRSWGFRDSVKAGEAFGPLLLARSTLFLVSLEYPDYQPEDSGVAFFPGTDIMVRCQGREVSRVDSVPAGVNHVVFRSSRGWEHDSTFEIYTDSVDLKANERGITCLQ